MRALAFLFVLSLSAVTACYDGSRPAADASFTPYGVTHAPPATATAVRLSDADRPALAKTGARYVGELELQAADGVAFEAAKVGATHYLQTSRGRYLLFRVDPKRWSELTAQLRPSTTPAEQEPVSTTMVTSAPLR